MSGLYELHNSYLNSLNAFTRATGKQKLNRKKDDEIGLQRNTTTVLKHTSLPMSTFPLTANMLFLSLLFWLCISTTFYFIITYGLMLSRITDESDLHGKCGGAFHKDKFENLKKVESYTVGEAAPYLLRLKPSKIQDYPAESKVSPPLVTGITSAQFYQLQGLVKHILEDIKASHSDLKLIVYDLGLYKRERELLEHYCHCEVRDLHFEYYPKHVSSISNYAWRPIIIQLVLNDYGSVVYVDPTTRFKHVSSLNFLRLRGSRNYFVWYSMVYTSLLAYTDIEMFKYFNESRCAFLDCSLLSSEAIAVYRTESTWIEFMRPWLTCALNEDCIAPKYAKYSGCIEIRHPKTTGCHRFDMSALSVVLNRGVQYTVDSKQMMSFRLTYTDVTEVTYFPSQPWTYLQLILLMFTPVLILIVYKYIFKKRRLCRL